jgi:predicted permease
VLCFAIAASLFSGLLFGVLPSLHAGRLHAFRTRSSSDTRGSRIIREALVAAQVMLALVLVTASISVGRAFVHLMNVDRGFDRSGVVTAAVSLDGTTHQSDGSRLAFVLEALDRIRRLPGVRSASTTQFLPLDAKGFIGGRYRMDGRPAATSSMVVPVMADYFRTMGGRMEAGREFTEADLRSNENIAIVNDVFAREFGQPADLIGREIANPDHPRRIVGVVKGMDYVAEGSQTSQIFVPSRSPGFPKTTFVVKVAGRAEDHLAMVRGAIQSVDPQVPLFDVKTMDQRMAGEFARPQFYKTAVMCFAAFALLLAIIGIYGIVSYTVARRTHEMGVRMALGTTPDKLRVTMLRQGLLPIAVGVIPGIAVGVVSGRLLESLVEGAKSVDAAAYAGAVLFIAWIAAIGIWVATRPIAWLDIVEILRTE